MIPRIVHEMTKPESSYRTLLGIALGAILVIAAALRFTGLSWDLRHTPHVDERYFVENVALMLTEGDLDYRFYEYPGLFFYLLYPVLAAVGASVPADGTAYLAARGVVAAFGVLSVGLVYWLGTRLAGPTTGLLAALFLAVSPVEVQTAHGVRPDVVLESFALLALLVFSTVGKPVRGDVTSGTALGAATAVKFSGALLVPSYVAYRLLAPGPYVRRTILAGAISLVTFLILSPYTLLDSAGFLDGVLTQVGYHYGGGIGVADYLGRLWTYVGHPQGTLRKSFGTLGVLLVLVGIVPAAREWKRWAPLLLFPLMVLAVFSTSLVHHDRFVLPALGVLALLAGRAGHWLAERWRPTLALVLLALAFPFYDSVLYVRDVSRPSTRDRALDWIETNLHPGARVVSALTDLGGPDKGFELVTLVSSPELFELQARNADALLLRPADAQAYPVAWPPTLAIEPRSEFSGPPLNLYVVPETARPRYEPLPLEVTWLAASESPERLPNLIDGRVGTFWGTAGPQRPGDWIQIQFPEPMVVARVELSLGSRPLRSARELRLEGRTEDAWIEIPYVMGRAGVQGQVVDHNGASQVLLFEPTLLHGVRLFQTGRRTRPWSISELRVDQSLSR